MTAREQLDRLRDERKLLAEKLEALDQQIRAQEQQIAAEAPAGWAAVMDWEGGYHVASLPGQGVYAGLPNDLQGTVRNDGSLHIFSRDPYVRGETRDHFFAPQEESWGVGEDGGRLGFFPTKEEAEAAITRWKAEEAD